MHRDCGLLPSGHTAAHREENPMAAREQAGPEYEEGRVVGLSLGESVKVYADRAGLTSDQRLADAANALLPEWVGMNRNLIQRLQRDEVALGNGLNELQVIAIARACHIPETWLGVDPYESGQLSRLKDLLIYAPSGGPDGDGGERRARSRRSSDQRKRDSRWLPVDAGQVA